MKDLRSVILFVKLVLYFQKPNMDQKVLDANLKVKTFQKRLRAFDFQFPHNLAWRIFYCYQTQGQSCRLAQYVMLTVYYKQSHKTHNCKGLILFFGIWWEFDLESNEINIFCCCRDNMIIILYIYNYYYYFLIS